MTTMLERFSRLMRLTRATPRASAIHEASRTGSRLRHWLPWDVSPRREHIALNVLRTRSRDAYRNNAIARAAIDRLVADIIGTGVSPKPVQSDEESRLTIINTWESWSSVCDADEQTDFYGLQTYALRAMLMSGEVLALLLPDDAGGIPLKIRLIESDYLPFKNGRLANGHVIVDGIELDAHSRRVAYWLHPNHPGDPDIAGNDPVRIPAAHVLHLFEPTRPGQLRGIPALAPVLVRLKDLDEFDDAQLIRQKIANLFVGFIKKDAPPEPEFAEEKPDSAPSDEETGPPAPEWLPYEFKPGLLQERDIGEDVTFSNPPGAPDGYREVTNSQLRLIASALGLPYALLTNDYRDTNDRVMRVSINEYKRRAMALIHNVLVPRFCAPIRDAWVDAAILTGVLPAGRKDLKLTRWTPHAWPYIHPVQDIESDILAINNKLKSRSEALLERGYDAELVDREIAADHEREDTLGLPTTPAMIDAAMKKSPQEKDD
jgi:lambda family phage portal protein